VGKLPGIVNYFVGNDPRHWYTNIPTYAGIVAKDVYPGIDLALGAKQGQLSYAWRIHLGADPATIRLRTAGAGQMRGSILSPQRTESLSHEVTAAGGLVFGTHLTGTLGEFGGSVAADRSGNTYVFGRAAVGFSTPLGAVQTPTKNLFIAKLRSDDGTVLSVTYFGGSGTDLPGDIAVDPEGDLFVTGTTSSHDFPITRNAISSTLSSATDGFVASLESSSSRFRYSTYLGARDTTPISIAVDGQGSAYITGSSLMGGMPTTPNAFRKSGGGVYVCGGHLYKGEAAFVAKLDPTGSTYTYSTYLDDQATGFAIALDGAGNAYVTGVTADTRFATRSAAQPVFGGAGPSQTCGRASGDAYVAKLNADGSALSYATYLGGSNDDAGFDIAVGGDGSAYVTGYTQSTDFPTRNAVQSTLRGQADSDAFVTKVGPAGDRFVYSTYLGGSAQDVTGNHMADYGTGIAVDQQGIAYVVGATQSSDFPMAQPSQEKLRGDQDAFVTVMDPTGQRLLESTYLGGDGSDSASDVAVDGLGSLYVTGDTESPNFPGANPTDKPPGPGAGEIFVAKLNLISAPVTPTATSTPSPTPTATSTPAPTATPTPRAISLPVAVPAIGMLDSAMGSFTVWFSSTLPGQGEVFFGSGPGCLGLVEVATQDAHPGTAHHEVVVDGNDLPGTVGNNGIVPGVTYWFETVTVTSAGIETDDNGGQCYHVAVPLDMP
jgi:hypothetical protein